MAQERLFTEEELRTLGMRTVGRLESSIDAGNTEEAKKLAGQMYREFLAMHDLLVDWVTASLTFMENNYGDEALYHALEAGVGAWLKPAAKLYEGKDAKARLKLAVGGMRGHLQPIRIIEDDEKFILMMEPCGSGGRLILNQKYEPPTNFAKVKEPQPMTYWRQDCPAYCAHCALQEILSIRWSGIPWMVMIPPDKLGEQPCQFLLYKDPDKVPEEYCKRFERKT